jgi:hypothetical protein
MRTIFPGLIFSAEGGGIRIKTTRRVDLAVTRVGQDARRLSDLENTQRLARRQGRQLERSFSPRTIGAIKTPSIEAARKLRRVLLRAIASPGSGDRLTEAQAYDALNRCRHLGLEVETIRLLSSEPPSPRDRHRPEHRHIGGTVAEVSMIDIIGGFVQGTVNLPELKRKRCLCWLSLDLSQKNDLTALTAVWIDEDGHLWAKTWYWTVKERLKERGIADHRGRRQAAGIATLGGFFSAEPLPSAFRGRCPLRR